jgi:SAM-dependent methyltransferase
MSLNLTSQKDLWNASAEAYDRHTRVFSTHTRITNSLIANVEGAPEVILDFGCGPGNSTLALARQFPNARSIIGVDSAVRMIEIANRATGHDARISCHCIDFDCLAEVSHEPFDLVVCSNSFFHIENKDAFLDAAGRLVHTYSTVIFSMYDFLFSPSRPITWPYSVKGNDELMLNIVNKLRDFGIPIEARKEEREVFTEVALSKLFERHSWALRVGGILRLSRGINERVSFFQLPVVAQEVFPGVPLDLLKKACLELPLTEDSPPQERNVYSFVAIPMTKK